MKQQVQSARSISGMALGAPTKTTSQQAKPPEKGVFPLDHFGECKEGTTKILACLKEHKGDADPCRLLVRAYLECRMEHGLMAKEDLGDLGFAPGSDAQHKAPKTGAT